MRNISKKPLFSIITVSYNSEATIATTFDSLLKQDYENLEYIVIDGNSTDNTRKVISEYQELFRKKLSNFVYISENDKGIYDAMNKGISLANGEWVGIINSDDFYVDNVISNISAFLETQPKAELLYGDMFLFDQGIVNKCIKPETDLNKMLNSMGIFHPTVFVKKKIYLKYGIFDLKYRLSADWDILKRFTVNDVKMVYFETPIAFFRRGGSGSGFTLTHLFERYKIRHRKLSPSFLWYDIKDLLIFFHYKIFPKKPLF